ncbi:MAG: hypothetical protein IJW40_00055 [Clostridia bacterium]|nr:hypothetical protein [Clostridia bacterium]
MNDPINNKEKDSFSYTYSAREQEEVRKIREKYDRTPPAEDKMEQLRRLDRTVTRKGTVASMTLGILGALFLGTGMSLIMTELGAGLGMAALPVGIAVGVGGIVLAALAYPIYTMLVHRERARIAPLILQLTDEMMHRE